LEIIVTRGLAELKLLDSRINKKIFGNQFVSAYKKSSGKIDGAVAFQDFEKNVQSNFASIIDLIERRKKIKEAIVKSNANTIVEINNKKMTVASAIERKESIQYEKNLLEEFQTQFSQAKSQMNKYNDEMYEKLDELLMVSFGKDGKQKVDESEIKSYIEQNEWVLADPLKIEGKIKQLEEDIDGFLREVDYVLSISNATTFIHIDD
jgi:hypothetical protein